MGLIYRPIVERVKNQLDTNNVIILIGARQVGKTSILKLLIEEIKRNAFSGGIFYFDLEKEEFLELFQSYRHIIDWLRLQGADLKKKNYLFIDEFHYITNPTKLFKIIHDDFPDLKIVATGSSSLEISQKIKESLTGRKRIFRVYPLNFEEFLEFKKSPLKDIFYRLKGEEIRLVEPVLSEFVREWEEFVLLGGYPKVAITSGVEEKTKELEEIYTSYVQKDIKAFLKVENVLAFNKLVKILAVQIGNLANLSQIGSPLTIARETLERYIFVLEHTFVIKSLPPFFTNKVKEITKMHKIYFLDNGLRNFSIKDFKDLELRMDKGALVENAVLTELMKNTSVLQDLHFWRTQAKTEVDIVLVDKGSPIPIEIKYRPFKEPKVPPGLGAFIENYKPKRAYVITREFSGYIHHNNCNLKFIPAFLSSTIV